MIVMPMRLKNKIKDLYNKGALHITVGTFVTKFVAFFGSIVVVRLLSKTDYGLMSYVENIYSYALIFAGLGLSNGILRFLVIVEDEQDKKSIFNYIIKRGGIINIFIALLMCILSVIIKFPESYSEAKFLIPVVALLLPFQDLLNEGLYTIRSFFKNKLYAYLAFASSVVLIGGRIVGAVINGVNGVLWSRVIINFLFAILIFLFARSWLFSKGPALSLPREKKREINIYSLQYMITNGFWAIFMLNDTFLLGLLLNDPVGLADYKVAYVLPGNISIFAAAIAIFVGPYFAKNEKNYEWVRRNYKKVCIVSAGIMGTAVILIAAFSRPLIELMFGEQYLNIIPLMRVLLLAAFFNSGLRFTTANLLASMGEVKYNMIISGIGIAIQTILDFMLIPHFGVMAVAVSNCFIYFFMAIALFFVFFKKYYHRRVD